MNVPIIPRIQFCNGYLSAIVLGRLHRLARDCKPVFRNSNPIRRGSDAITQKCVHIHRRLIWANSTVGQDDERWPAKGGVSKPHMRTFVPRMFFDELRRGSQRLAMPTSLPFAFKLLTVDSSRLIATIRTQKLNANGDGDETSSFSGIR